MGLNHAAVLAPSFIGRRQAVQQPPAHNTLDQSNSTRAFVVNTLKFLTNPDKVNVADGLPDLLFGGMFPSAKRIILETDGGAGEGSLSSLTGEGSVSLLFSSESCSLVSFPSILVEVEEVDELECFSDECRLTWRL